MVESEELRNDLKNFIQFTCEKKPISGDVVISSSINILRKIPSSKAAVLVFFRQLFDDLVDQYLDDNCYVKSNKCEADCWWRLLINPAKPNPIAKERKSSDSLCAVDGDTPMSPPAIETGNANVLPPANSTQTSTENTSIDTFIDQIGQALNDFVLSEECNCRTVYVDWCLQFISSLSGKYPIQNISSTSATIDPVTVFSGYIKFWTKCHVVELILKIIMAYSSSTITPNSCESLKSSQHSTNCTLILQQLIEFSPASDWISAHLISSIPSQSDSSLFSSCIQCLLQSNISQPSMTNILSYISENNPQAIINASKSNIPFLLNLAANSKPLLNLLAIEAAKQVNIRMLNEFSTTLQENVKPPVIHCILNANNSFQLLLLVFEAAAHKDSNDIVREKAFNVLKAIIARVHELVYTANANTATPILADLKANADQLVTHTLSRSSGPLRKLQLQLIHYMCLHFGLDFTSRVFHQILNSLNITYDICSPETVYSPNPILSNLIKYLKLSYGLDVYKCFHNAVKEQLPKEPKFWANLLALFDSEDSLELNLDELTAKFTQYTQTDPHDQRVFYTLKLILCCVERDPRLVKRPKHHLCISLMSTYMKLLDTLQKNDNELELKMQMITVCQKLMSHLSKNLQANQHILTRTLIEAELQRNDRASIIYTERIPSHVNLFKENLEYGNITKFRKISLNARKIVFETPRNGYELSLRRQLLLDAVRCCVTDSQAFATLLVECVTPDVMFNDKPWPDEDFLKVTIERDLHIARKFNSNPVLWDFCELIAKTGNLYSCSVLIRALMAVQLCCWASATASKDKLGSTQKLVTLIAASELVPNIPFKYLPQIMESLTPWEIFCVLNDLWRYMRDNSPPSVRPNQGSLRTYLERLRIIASQKVPGPVFVKIFKVLQTASE